MRKLFTLKYLLVLLFVGVTFLAQGQTNPSAQTLPYSQNFNSFTGSTTVYPSGIQGWGFGTTGLTTSFNTAAPTADQALTGATNASTSAFVGDMNGKIGLLATGSNIKAICLAISTTAFSNMNVSYLAATQRQVTTERINELGMQYRIGTTGTFTNLSGSTYQNNLAISNTTGTGSVNPLTISFSLPSGCDNQPVVQLRWIQRDVSGAGGRPSFSVDDISITGTAILSSNANLSDLTLSTGTLSPVFASSTISYTSTVANSVTGITIRPTAAQPNATIKVNNTTVTSGTASGNIPLTVGSNNITTVVTAQDGTTTKTYTVTVTRAAAGTPTLTASTLTDFGNVCINTTAGPNSFSVDGSNLDGSNSSMISIAALSGYSYSLTSAGTYTSTLDFTYTGSSFAGQVVYVKFTPTAVQSYNANIVLSGGGVTGYNVPAIGSGVNTNATVTTNAGSTSGTSVVFNGSITSQGCSAITSYGFEYSPNSGFTPGTGTTVTASNLSGGNFSASVTGLVANRRYYYKAYATASNGTVYGLQVGVNAPPVPVNMSAQPGLSFTEDFADIANWLSFFGGGIGAQHFSQAVTTVTSGTTPNPNIVTSNTVFSIGGSGGVQRGNEQLLSTTSIVLLSTGGAGTDNTTSAAFDFYMDFTGLNAGTLSFEYAVVNNSTGNRNGSLRVYYTIDGITFTEIPFASVLNFTNNIALSGTKSNITLPSLFDNNPNARLRFYYNNGTGGVLTGSQTSITGSRPKISIDNLTVTGLATTPCAAPAAPATSLLFGTITDTTISASFTAASPATDSYLIVMSTDSSLISNPNNGQNYSLGDNVGDGSVIAKGAATSFTATGLNALTTYYFFVFPMNAICTGGPLYYTTTVLKGNATTIAGLPPCAAPTTQPTNLTFGTTMSTSIAGSFTATTADQYLVVRSLSASLGADPVNGTLYNTGDALGNGTVVQRSSNTNFTATGLTPDMSYNFFVFSLNASGCINGPAYNISNPLTGTRSTIPLPLCVAPAAQPSSLMLTAANSQISGTFIRTNGADTYVVVQSTSATLGASPTDGTNYVAGDAFGSGTVLSNNGNPSFVATNLAAGNTYYFFVFAANKTCSGGTKYATQPALTGSMMTTNTPNYNYYFGNLHAHSDYSDGNKDNPGFTPAQDYDYARTAECMDYLGISEHNHFSTLDNPGNLVSTYHLGTDQANTFTNNNPNFLALYGMEWGVISNGGHVVIYGNGLDQLFGWETGSGPWGPNNNYDVFVPKSDYTGLNGLFKTVNDFIATTNSFATLAHPKLTDYNNIAGTAYNAVADNAIVGSAIESGPAFSTNTTYSDPSNFNNENYLFYFNTMLAKGYHLGPVIDHDNHNTTFGKTTYSRTAIVSRSLSKDSVVKSMRDMHFYATRDCDSKLDFTINTQIMGSTLTDRFGPNISVKLTDITTSTSSAVIRLMFGIPGSGTLAVKIDSAIGNTLFYNDATLADLGTGYYYIDVINGSSRVISSPIWYTRNDASSVLPVKLSAFTAQKSDNRVQLDWTTEQETNSSHFIVQRSTDGRIWSDIARVSAAGNSTMTRQYRTYDNAPVNGNNYYRLKQVDLDGRFDVSEIRNVNIKTGYNVSISPNPAKDFINIYVTKDDIGLLNINVIDLAGKIVRSTRSTEKLIRISTAGLAGGIYFINIRDKTNSHTQKIIIE